MHKTGVVSLPIEEETEVTDDFISDYAALVKRIVADAVRDVGDYRISFDDLYQEGLIALCNAKHAYKSTGEATFTTYAFKAVRNRVMREVLRYNSIYFYERSYSVDPSKYEKLFADEEESEYKSVVEDFLKKINKTDRMILTLYLKGKSYSEIAELTNTNRKRVDNRLCLLKKRLIEYYKNLNKD